MPKKVTYYIEITCTNCPTTFIKKPKTGNLCEKCRTDAKKASRRKIKYDECRMCHTKKKANQSPLCNKCHSIKYRKNETRIAPTTQKKYLLGLGDLVYRLTIKQSNFIYSLYDINDIIEYYSIFKPGKILLDIYSPGRQIEIMWQELLKIHRKNNG